MLRIYFGDKENAIYNTSVYFKNKYKDEWITDEFAKEVILFAFSDVNNSMSDIAAYISNRFSENFNH